MSFFYYKLKIGDSWGGHLCSFFHAESEGNFFKKNYHSVKKFVGHMAPPTGQILILTKKSKERILKPSKNLLQNFEFEHWPNFKIRKSPFLPLGIIS